MGQCSPLLCGNGASEPLLAALNDLKSVGVVWMNLPRVWVRGGLLCDLQHIY